MTDTPVAPTTPEEQLQAALDAFVLAVEASGDPPLPTGFEGKVLRNLYNLGFMVVPRAARSTPAEALDPWTTLRMILREAEAEGSWQFVRARCREALSFRSPESDR